MDDKGQVLRAEVALEAEEVPHTAEKTIGDEAALLRGEENGEDKAVEEAETKRKSPPKKVKKASQESATADLEDLDQ